LRGNICSNLKRICIDDSRNFCNCVPLLAIIYKNIYFRLRNMQYFDIILYFLGFLSVKSDVGSRIIVNLDSSENINLEHQSDSLPWFRRYAYAINMVQIVTIAIFIGWESVYSVVYAVTQKQYRHFTSNIFSLMYFSQYILSVRHIKNMKMSKLMDNALFIHIVLLIGIIISSAIPLLVLILVTNGVYVNIYSNLFVGLTEVSKVFFCLLLYFSKFFSYTVFFVDVMVFTLMFTNHCYNIGEYVRKLNDVIEGNTTDITSEMVIGDYCVLKTMHTKYVDMMNDIFTSITFFGFVGSYYVFINVGSGYNGVLNYIDISCFCFIEIIYIFTINKVKSSVDDIKKLILSEKYINSSLSKALFKEILPNDDKETETEKINTIKNISMRSMIRIHESAQSLDWLVLSKKLEEEWDTFKIFGFEIKDSDIVQRLVAIVFGVLMLINFDQKIGIVIS